jgi:hypothetical protein
MSPKIARQVPDHRQVSGAVNHHKALAWRAWRSARALQPIPLALVDRLWTNALTAAAAAPPAVAAVMYRRTETMLRLMVDQSRWSEPPPPPAPPRPRLQGGPRPHWDRLARRGPK